MILRSGGPLHCQPIVSDEALAESEAFFDHRRLAGGGSEGWLPAKKPLRGRTDDKKPEFFLTVFLFCALISPRSYNVFQVSYLHMDDLLTGFSRCYTVVITKTLVEVCRAAESCAVCDIRYSACINLY